MNLRSTTHKRPALCLEGFYYEERSFFISYKSVDEKYASQISNKEASHRPALDNAISFY
jgi:hypothetical protein